MSETILYVIFLLGGLLFFPLVCLCVTQLTGCGPLWWKNSNAIFLRKFKSKFRPFEYSHIVPGLLLGSLPRSDDNLSHLVTGEQVTGIVTMNMDWELVLKREDIEAAGLDWLHLPTPDYCAVSQSDLAAGVAFIDKHLKENGVVYVHCNAGKGRSTSGILCYLIKNRGMPRLEAYKFCKQKRHKIAKFTALCGTRPQWRAVGRYEKSLQGKLSPRKVFPTTKP